MPLADSDPGFDLRSPDAAERLRYVIHANSWVNAIFGVIRTEALAKTRLLPGYPGGDYPLLGELALLGKFVEIPKIVELYGLRFFLIAHQSDGLPHEAPDGGRSDGGGSAACIAGPHRPAAGSYFIYESERTVL